MNEADVERIAQRLLIHLRADQYEACYDILQEAERVFANGAEARQERRDELKCLANLPIELRWINTLEKAGYVYLEELDGVDIRNMSIKHLGTKGKNAIFRAVNKAREQLALL